MSSVNIDNFISSFPIWIHFLSFYCLIALAGTSSTTLSTSSKSRPPLTVLSGEKGQGRYAALLLPGGSGSPAFLLGLHWHSGEEGCHVTLDECGSSGSPLSSLAGRGGENHYCSPQSVHWHCRGGRSLLPGRDESLSSYLACAEGNGEGATVFLWYLTRVGWLLFKRFLSW